MIIFTTTPYNSSQQPIFIDTGLSLNALLMSISFQILFNLIINLIICDIILIFIIYLMIRIFYISLF
jgi:hypothetical protein